MPGKPKENGIRQSIDFMSFVSSLNEHQAREHCPALARVLVECVDNGASVNFMAGFTKEAAERFFDGIVLEVQAGRRILLAAFEGESLVGTVQIVLAMPPNQQHRAEIAKLLVSPSVRRRGIGADLMRAAEEHARQAGKTLLVLDTVTGEAGEALYTRLGWTKAGEIPNYALFPDGKPCATSIFWKALTPAGV